MRRHSRQAINKTLARHFLASSPASLQYLYGITSGRARKEILGRLLTSGEMDGAWKTLMTKGAVGAAQGFSHRSANDAYRRLWSEICFLLIRGRRRDKTWQAIDDDLKNILDLATKLRSRVIEIDRENEGKPPERRRRRDLAPKTGERFDVSLKRYCPETVRRINDGLVVVDRGQVRRRWDVVEWPRLSEVLDGLIEQVAVQRNMEMSRKRLIKRVHDKSGEKRRQQRYFVIGLARYVENAFGLSRDTESIPITAAIATAVFNEKILRDFVRKALRRH